MNSRRKIITALILLFVFGAGAFLFFANRAKAPQGVLPEEKLEEERPVAIERKPEVEIKDSVLLSIPFTVQAPYANWAVHEQSCEEAALLMYHYFTDGVTSFGGSTVIPPDSAVKDIVDMKNWQVKNYGAEPDLSIEQFADFAKSYYGLDSKIIDATGEEIKKELSGGNPVIVPATTKSLENPFFPAGSNVYHYLLIKGYNQNGIITNDPGTKRGEGYFYTWDILTQTLSAQKAFVDQGSVAIVLYK